MAKNPFTQTMRVPSGSPRAPQAPPSFTGATAKPSPPSVGLVSIAVTPANATFGVSMTEQYTAIGTYADSSTLDLTSTVNWTSSNTGVATIAPGGLATGVATGTSNITATDPLSGVNGSTNVTVAIFMPAGFVLGLDVSVGGSVTTGTFGAAGTPAGLLVSAVANQGSGGGSATQATQANAPTLSPFALNAKPGLLMGGDADTFTPGYATTGLALPSLTYGAPFTIAFVGRFDHRLIGTVLEASANVATNPGYLVSLGGSTSVAVHGNTAEQTAKIAALTPSAIYGASLKANWRSDLGVTSGAGTISAWVDQSGNGFTLGPGTAQPTYTASGGVNNRPFLSATGSTNVSLVGSTSLALSPPYEIWTTFFVAVSGSSEAWGDFGDINHGWLGYVGSQHLYGNSAGVSIGDISGAPDNTLTFAQQSVPSGTPSQLVANGTISAPGATSATVLGIPTVINAAPPAVTSANGKLYERTVLSTVSTPNQQADMFTYNQNLYGDQRWMVDDLPHRVVIAGDGTDAGLSITVDGVTYIRTTNATAPGVGAFSAAGTLGFGHGLALPMLGAVAGLWIYTSKLSTPQIAAADAYMQTLGPPAVITGSQLVQLETFGDSIAQGFGVQNDPLRTLIGRIAAYRGPVVATTANPPLNHGISGTQLVQGANNCNLALQTFPASTTLTSVCVIISGINDLLVGRTAAQMEADLLTVVATAQARAVTAGQTIHYILNTLTFWAAGGADWPAYNAYLKANIASFSTTLAKFHLCDPGADDYLGINGGVAPFFFTPSAAHPSGPGYEYWYGLIKPIFDALGF